MLIGVIGSGFSVYKWYRAPNDARRITSRGMRGETEGETIDSEKFMLRDEFNLYDIFKTIHIFTFFMSCMFAMIGRAGLGASRW
jgi:hypothetical protein